MWGKKKILLEINTIAKKYFEPPEMKRGKKKDNWTLTGYAFILFLKKKQNKTKKSAMERKISFLTNNSPNAHPDSFPGFCVEREGRASFLTRPYALLLLDAVLGQSQLINMIQQASYELPFDSFVYHLIGPTLLSHNGRKGSRNGFNAVLLLQGRRRRLYICCGRPWRMQFFG